MREIETECRWNERDRERESVGGMREIERERVSVE